MGGVHRLADHTHSLTFESDFQHPKEYIYTVPGVSVSTSLLTKTCAAVGVEAVYRQRPQYSVLTFTAGARCWASGRGWQSPRDVNSAASILVSHVAVVGFTPTNGKEMVLGTSA